MGGGTTTVSNKNLEKNQTSQGMVVHALGRGRRIRNLRVSSATQSLRQARLGNRSP